MTYSASDVDVAGDTIVDPYGTVIATKRETGLDFEQNKFGIGGTPVTATGPELNILDDVCATVDIALAASATTDGMDITITVLDGAGTAIDVVHELEVWVSEDAQGEGLTADSASGDLTWGTGTELQEIVSKKHYKVLTTVAGVAVATLVDSANPTDQYIAVRHPVSSKVIVSAASGTSWEGV